MTYVGFCSSLLGSDEDVARDDRLRSLRALRLAVRELGQKFGGVFVAEVDRTLPVDPLESADALLGLIRTTPFFFCILGPPHYGSQIGIARTSYFEIELFQAAVLQRPIYVFEFEGFSPEPTLRSILSALRPSLNAVQWLTVRSDKEVLLAIERILAHSGERVSERSLFSSLPNLVTCLWRVRAREAELQHGFSPSRWLDGAIIPGPPPDEVKVKRLLADAQAQENKERKLGRLWLASRELMGAPYQTVPDLRSLWWTTLSTWWSTASWYGLHGHAFLGPLAAGKTVEDLHGLIATDRVEGSDNSFAYPAGALASSHYSIAKLLLDGRGRRWHYAQALSRIARGLDEGIQDRSDLLLIRGSIALRQRRPWTAVDDYKTALTDRAKRGAPSHQIGEALSELGFAYVFAGRPWRGRQLIDDGVALLANATEPGFLLRAERKLVFACLATGQLKRAFALRRKVREDSSRSAHFDQTRQA